MLLRRSLLCLAVLLTSKITYAEELTDSVPYLVYIRPGSVLVRISDNKEFLTEKGIYTKVHEKNLTKKDVFNVYDNKNQLVYTTKSENILEIKEDIRIYPNKNAEIIYPEKTTFRTANKSFDFDLQFNFHMDSIDTDAFSSYYLSEATDVSSNRFELRAVYQSNLPVNFGATLSLQQASWLIENDKVTNQVLAIGPVIEYNFYKNDWIKTKAILSAEFTPIYETKSSASLESYSTLIYNIGLEANLPTRYGTFSLGTHFRKHEINLSSSTRENPIGFEQEEISYSSLGMMLGYKLDWQL